MTQPPQVANNITYEIPQLLELMLQHSASDLHLKAGKPPGLRVDGCLRVAENLPPLTPDECQYLAEQLIPEDRREEYERGKELDCSYEIPGVSRYRVCVFRQRGSVGVALRRIPVEIPAIERLGLPDVAKKLAMMPRGLVLVTGPTGCGKSTTLAALVDYLNRNSKRHIVTLEDPIEFIHQDRGCFITQREIGIDTESFRHALRRVLRQDPDVIMIGELRDLETISMAITAAETGHLVFATLHTTGAVQTVDRILDAYPVDARSQIRIQLSMNLRGVLSQNLVRKIHGGRTAAVEVLVMTEAARSCVREGKTHQLANLIQTGAPHGMQTLNSSLADLVRSNVVSEHEACAISTNTEDFQHALKSAGRPLRHSQESDVVHPQSPSAATPERATTNPRDPASVPSAVTSQSVLEKLRRS